MKYGKGETFSNSFSFTLIKAYDKGALCRFEQCLGLFTMFFVGGSSGAGLLTHLCNNVFCRPKFRKYGSYEDHLVFSKCSKIDLDFKNGEKNPRKSFCFLKILIWIGCAKLSLLRREYLSSAVNELTNSSKILHITKRDFFQLIFLHTDQEIIKTCCHAHFNNFWDCLPCCLSKGVLQEDFLYIYVTTFFEVGNFGNI